MVILQQEIKMENNNEGAASAEAAVPGKRTFIQQEKKGLQIKDILLISILLASGAVLKFFVPNMGGMKPNFIIAMYCLTILLIKPRLLEAAIIGLLAGAISQIFPAQPYINFASELTGALAMCLLVKVPIEKIKIPVKPAICTFFSTLVSGFTFIGIMYLLYYVRANNVTPAALAVFLGVVFGTATINSIIVQLLYIPLKLVLKK
jgi:hypothetical protein